MVFEVGGVFVDGFASKILKLPYVCFYLVECVLSLSVHGCELCYGTFLVQEFRVLCNTR